MDLATTLGTLNTEQESGVVTLFKTQICICALNVLVYLKPNRRMENLKSVGKINI